MKDRGREDTATSKSPSTDRSIPRGTDEHAPEEADEAVEPSDTGATKRASERKRDGSSG